MVPSPQGYKLESCVETYAQADLAVQRGADRLEVCSRLETAGMTPDIALVKKIIAELSIPVRVMIRETESGFEADARVISKMKSAIEAFKSLGVHGFVIGLLDQHRLDRRGLDELMRVCAPFPITIHKAIDLSEDVEGDINWLNQYPQMDAILTSGKQETAVAGIQEILKMKSWFTGEIMAAGKITPSVLPALHEQLELSWYHGRAIV